MPMPTIPPSSPPASAADARALAPEAVDWRDGWAWLRVWFLIGSLLIAIRHGLRLVQVLRLATSPVLETWPWRVPWPWVAGASGVVLLAWVCWLVLLVRRPVQAWQVFGWALVLYVVWGWVETGWWAAADLSIPRWLFVLGRGLLMAGLGWWGTRGIVTAMRAQEAHFPKEAP